MSLYVRRGDLWKQIHEYRDLVRSLVHENYQLRRGFNQIYAELQAANTKIANTEHFLAVLQGEQLN